MDTNMIKSIWSLTLNNKVRKKWRVEPVITQYHLNMRSKSHRAAVAALQYLPTGLLQILSPSVPEIVPPLIMLHLQKCVIRKASHFQNREAIKLVDQCKRQMNIYGSLCVSHHLKYNSLIVSLVNNILVYFFSYTKN